MPIETVNCPQCGSTEVTEFKAGSYVCTHCEGTFKHIDPSRVTVASEVCACGRLPVGRCVECGYFVCEQCAASNFGPLHCRQHDADRLQTRLEERRERLQTISDPLLRYIYNWTEPGQSAPETQLSGEEITRHWAALAKRYGLPVSDALRFVDKKEHVFRGARPRLVRVCGWWIPEAQRRDDWVGREERLVVWRVDHFISDDGLLLVPIVAWDPLEYGREPWEYTAGHESSGLRVLRPIRQGRMSGPTDRETGQPHPSALRKVLDTGVSGAAQLPWGAGAAEHSG